VWVFLGTYPGVWTLRTFQMGWEV